MCTTLFDEPDGGLDGCGIVSFNGRVAARRRMDDRKFYRAYWTSRRNQEGGQLGESQSGRLGLRPACDAPSLPT